MAVVTIAALKAYFQTGDFPTQTEFENLIDTLGSIFTPVTKSQITSTQNDYSLGEGCIFRLSSDIARSITGFSGGADGRIIKLINVGTQQITISGTLNTSIAANRIDTNSFDIVLASKGAVELCYDATVSRWKMTNSFTLV